MGQLFRTEYNIIFLVLAFALSAVVSFYYYRQTGLPSSKRNLLTVIRTFTIFLILLLLAAPVISYVSNIERTPVNVFLVDNSGSLTLEGRDSILRNNTEEKLPGLNLPAENIFFTFSNDIMMQIEPGDIENIQYSGINNFETNLTNSLLSLQNRFINRNLSSVTVISDGIINEGGNPLSASLSLGVPFNYILVGDTVQAKDLVIRNVFFNKTTFIESNAPVKVELQSFGYDRDVRINLYENGSFITSKNIQVISERNLYEIDFNLSSPSEGVKNYKIEAEILEDEITDKNNFQEFLIKYVDNSFKVLVLSGGPGPDFAFISSELKKVRNFETVFRTQKNAAEYYEGPLPDINEFDAFIFIGYPTAITNDFLLNDIHSDLLKRKSSLFFFAGRNTDYAKLSIFEDVLPFSVSGMSDIEEETGVNMVSQIDSDILSRQSGEKDAGLLSLINSFSNIFMNKINIIPKPSSETFLISAANSQPVFLINNTELSKSAAFLAHGLYKWRLNRFNLNSGEVLNHLITSTLIKITDKEKRKAFSIETTKQVYSKFENVFFRAFINNYEIKGGERITVDIRKNSAEGEPVQHLVLTKKDNNYYEGPVNIPENGIYYFNAQLLNESGPVESDYNSFIIGENNFEYKSTKADNSTLSLLQNETGGMNFTSLNANDMEAFLNEINRESEEGYRALRNYPLNINPFYLTGLILLLCLEWFLRKRNNLP